MPIALIAAAAGKKLVIGNKGDLPWHFSSDLKFFKETTLGHPVVMGRVTYQSILNRLKKPLPGRRNIVITRNTMFQQKNPDVEVLFSPGEIVPLAKDSQIFVIGGATIYKQTMVFADTIYLTEIDQDVEGDAFFPPLDEKQWALTDGRNTIENGVKLHFNTYKRI